jgi:CHAT domain-containing protein
MNKTLLFLLMPFFIACTGSKKNDDRASVLIRLLKEHKIDSLSLLGSVYTWTGKANIRDSNFRKYILLNKQIGDSIYQWRRGDKRTKPFYNNVTLYETQLAVDTFFSGVFLYSLYRKTEADFEYKYDETVTNNFEKCRNYQLRNPSLDSNDYFDVLQSLGIGYHVLGENEKALNFYNQALSYYLPAKNGKKIASVTINFSSYYAEHGAYDWIIDNVPQALAYKNIKPKRIATLKAYYAEALYEKGNTAYKQELRDAWDSLQHIPYKDMGEDEWGKKTDIIKLKGQIALKEKHYDAAIQFFKQALDTCNKKNGGNNHERNYAKILLRIANVFDTTRQYDMALQYCQQALACVTRVDSANIATNPQEIELYTENTIMEALDAKARLLLKKYESGSDKALLENAVECYRLAFLVEQKLTDNFTYDDSREEMQRQSKTRSSAAIRNCYILHNITNDAKWAEEAFRFSENSKALLLLEGVKKNIFFNKYLKDDPQLKKLDSLKLQYAYIEKQILTTPNSTDSKELSAKKEALEKYIGDALTAIQASNAFSAKLEQSVQADLLPSIRQNLLGKTRSLVEFFSNKDDNYVFIVNERAAMGFYRIDSTALSATGRLLQFYDAPGNISNNKTGYKQVANELYNLCFFKQVPDKVTELLLIPDGIFTRLPFDALLTAPDISEGLKNCPYMLNRFITSYGYSAASLLQQEGNDVSTGKVFAFAPGFLQRERNLNPLQQSAKEVGAIDADSVYTGSSADIATFKRILGTAGIIHLATHAGLDTLGTTPWLEFADSSFLINELYARHINTRLVMLNACQTNKGMIHESEGALSLARGFYYAGAKNVVASLWNVDDFSGAKIAEIFYRRAKKNGYNFSAALHQAKKDFLADNPGGAKYSPYYWAAFMHIGGAEKSTGLSKLPVYGGAIGAVILLLIVFYRRKKGKR